MTTRKFPILFEIPGISVNQGNSFINTEALTAYDDERWEFLKNVVGTLQGKCYLDPDILGLTPNISAVNLLLTVYANAITGVTRMNVSTKAVADGESFNPATLDAAIPQDIAVPGTAYFRKDISFALTAGSFDSDDHVIVKVTHEGTHVNDTLASNTLLSKLAFLEVVFT